MTAPAAPPCGEKQPHGYGTCTRDAGHRGAHLDEDKDIYWQAEVSRA